ncbi:DUF4296 domain-containing protein [Flavobacterium sp. SUN046]|uniref:DUF4296 domain-containing protein n=1 Tax=Flavobacterium sp. SUN046 TaxID=3002440 RepID=UPI002DB9940F|nr:DUF4296 domain-containing protein [Flavobacterium sp. SUN046]MEC4049968.1 DUF4296 domain-containing protein [Flavobacterium sp. SUN046]
MKKLILLFTLLLVGITSCKEEGPKKPKHFIEKNKMVDMMYDLSILEAAKAQNIVYQNNFPTAKNFLKKKYNVDSLTFAENTKYYASDLKEYKKMYETVKARIDEDIKKNNGGKPIAPNNDAGVVR